MKASKVAQRALDRVSSGEPFSAYLTNGADITNFTIVIIFIILTN